MAGMPPETIAAALTFDQLAAELTKIAELEKWGLSAPYTGSDLYEIIWAHPEEFGGPLWQEPKTLASGPPNSFPGTAKLSTICVYSLLVWDREVWLDESIAE